MSVSHGVHSIDHYALNVPSLAEAYQFFKSFGLDVQREPNQLLLKAIDGHVSAKIFPAASKSLAYLSFNCYEQDFSALRQQIETAGGRFADRPEPGIWFHDPDGNLLQVKVGEKTMPNQKSDHQNTITPPNRRGATTRDAMVQIRPRRLSHVLLFTPNVLGALHFYEQALGLKLSDKSMDIIAFSHAPHGCDHHLVAFAKSSAKGWHHAAWEVDSIDEVGAGASQMAKAGHTKGWGTGRHCLGSNYFHYVQDPWGSFCEYSADMDYIGEGVEWPAGDYPPENSLYLWGPDVPDNFIFNTEADTPAPA
ncbi:VOC family protein [Pseudomonas sp. 10B1]|uniref:VOC family protein n=1 Tax=unclassified Pseudomonas TaxID=196821 RepID=UPI002AB41A5E|nr:MULTISPECIES: VOC family protein [unclassified Pseudomonas]MDY7562199.1 VOC family protein [Pseudomonas sp. AB6]MEA9979688.1 VOC family protein [Pseudomonas sp. RTS4]MEA9996132.1 VOC family protein [Pseudomonas sp. AA4]MEB0087554.1 VOC family protein [Pseudomonas sp. RTI1]MEB0127644.1 VOC family protein [Pseudomonas sp. CCC1.2]